MSDPMRLYKECLARIQKLMNWDEEKAKLWMRTPNPLFGGATPNFMFASGRQHKLLAFIKAAESGEGI